MLVQIQTLLIILSLISGVIAIILANRIMRKYPLNFLSSYFYFLVFNYIFSVYSIIGSQTISRVLQNNETPFESVRSVEAMLIALGIPFLILAIYMFLRMSRELFRHELPGYFVALYFSLFALSFVGYALLNIDIGGFETINFFLDRQQLLWTFSGLLIIAFGYALLDILINIRSLRDINQRVAYRWFVFWYAVIITLSVVSMQLSTTYELFALLFIMVFTGFHLLPTLFLSLYLQRFYVEKTEAAGYTEKFQQVIAKYEISKRESEIVELICKGMSNQEISDSLFISLQTVKDHVHRIFTKTGVKNRVQLTNLVDRGDS